jgi:hypothetical protein
MDDQQDRNLEKSSNIDCSNNEIFKYEDLSKIHVLKENKLESSSYSNNNSLT